MHEPLNQSRAEQDQAAIHELDQHLTRVLEAAPPPQIPADFAARVVSRLPGRRPVSLRATYYGFYATVAAMVVILIVLLVMAGHYHPANNPAHSTFALILQWTLCAQFIGIAVWLAARRHDLG